VGVSESHIQVDPADILKRFDPLNRLETYFDLLLEENRKINLVSRETSREDLRRLAVESLVPLNLLELPVGRYLDIGSGGGLPSIPILLAEAVTGESRLVERTQKKAAALRRILLELGLSAEVVPSNYEETRPRGRFDLVTIRLVKPTRPVLRKIHSELNDGGIVIYYSSGITPEKSFASEIVSFSFPQSTQYKQLTILHRI
jgi:16S rRNA (guanine527-N7)-methyltransferase